MRKYDPDKLIQARTKSGMLQRDVARQLKVHRSTIYRAEQGQGSVELVLDLAEFFGLPVDDDLFSKRVKASNKNGNHKRPKAQARTPRRR
jgi:DNA-binding XRE family transcriptional regulator